MSHIKQEIDRAMKYYGERATVFRVVRRGIEAAIIMKIAKRHIEWLHGKATVGFVGWQERRKRYIHHIRRLLPIDRPVTTERLKQAMEDR